ALLPLPRVGRKSEATHQPAASWRHGHHGRRSHRNQVIAMNADNASASHNSLAPFAAPRACRFTSNKPRFVLQYPGLGAHSVLPRTSARRGETDLAHPEAGIKAEASLGKSRASFAICKAGIAWGAAAEKSAHSRNCRPTCNKYFVFNSEVF